MPANQETGHRMGRRQRRAVGFHRQGASKQRAAKPVEQRPSSPQGVRNVDEFEWDHRSIVAQSCRTSRTGGGTQPEPVRLRLDFPYLSARLTKASSGAASRRSPNWWQRATQAAPSPNSTCGRDEQYKTFGGPATSSLVSRIHPQNGV